MAAVAGLATNPERLETKHPFAGNETSIRARFHGRSGRATWHHCLCAGGSGRVQGDARAHGRLPCTLRAGDGLVPGACESPRARAHTRMHVRTREPAGACDCRIALRCSRRWTLAQARTGGTMANCAGQCRPRSRRARCNIHRSAQHIMQRATYNAARNMYATYATCGVAPQGLAALRVEPRHSPAQ